MEGARGIGKGEGGERNGKWCRDAGCAGMFVGGMVWEIGEAEETSSCVARGVDLRD